MRNASWNCSPNPGAVNFNSIDQNLTEEIGAELKMCRNGGNCQAFELKDASRDLQKGHRCKCPDGFRYDRQLLNIFHVT